jgi:hypothetical protein
MTTIILAAVIPLSVNFLLAAAAFRIPELQLAPDGARLVPGLDMEEEPSGAEIIDEVAAENEVTKQAA